MTINGYHRTPSITTLNYVNGNHKSYFMSRQNANQFLIVFIDINKNAITKGHREQKINNLNGFLLKKICNLSYF